MTMGAGADISERFGHNAIWVRDTVLHTDAIYNYGTFSFPTSFAGGLAFAGRFLMGRPQYWLGVDSSIDHTVAEYRYAQRDLSVQELNLSPPQRSTLAARLAWNALPANRVYTYDYYRDNCSTRVRNMLDSVLGGALRRATRDRPGEGSLRFHTLRSTTNNVLLFTGIDAALGPRVDLPLDQWDEMFLPAKVRERVGALHVVTPEGQDIPLVRAEAPLLTIGVHRVEGTPPRWLPRFLLAGLLIAAIASLAVFSGPAGVIGRVAAGFWLCVTGAGGVLLLFLWLATANVATYSNHNVLVLTPLGLALLPALWRDPERNTAPWRLRTLHVAIASVAIGVMLTLVPIITRQDNALVLALAVPPSAATFWIVSRRLRPA